MKPGEATEARALRLRRIAKTYGRLPAGQEEESQLEKDMVRIAKAEYCRAGSSMCMSCTWCWARLSWAR